MTGLHSQDHDGQAWLFRFRDLQQQISADACPFVAREVPTPRARLNGNIARQTLSKDMTIWDDALLGFGLRVRCSGYKSWVLKFQERKSPRFVTLGSAKEMDAPTARQQARRLLERIALDGLPTKAG